MDFGESLEFLLIILLSVLNFGSWSGCQLKVTYSGPISVNGPQRDSKGNLVYNVSLRLAANETQYDNWLERFGDYQEADGRYKANFFFTVIDERTQDRVQVGDSFFFTDFSK